MVIDGYQSSGYKSHFSLFSARRSSASQHGILFTCLKFCGSGTQGTLGREGGLGGLRGESSEMLSNNLRIKSLRARKVLFA